MEWASTSDSSAPQRDETLALLRAENTLLHAENTRLRQEVEQMKRNAPATTSTSGSSGNDGAAESSKQLSTKRKYTDGAGHGPGGDSTPFAASCMSTEAAAAPSASAKATAAASPTLNGLLQKFETFIFDCDGVIWGISPELQPGVVRVINQLLHAGKRVMFITNNSNKRRKAFITQLESMSIDFGTRTHDEKLSMIISAAYTTAEYLKRKGLKRPFVVTSDTGVLDELKIAGITDVVSPISANNGALDPDFESAKMDNTELPGILRKRGAVDCVVVGWDMCLTARKVAAAINYIQWHADLHGGKEGYKPLPLIACSGDSGGVLGTVLPMDPPLGDGVSPVKVRAIGNGAMVEIIARSFDPPLTWRDMGKPSDALLEMLTTAYNVDASNALMIGDTLQTDIVFGNRGGMATLLVLSGVTSELEYQTARAASDKERHPTFVLPNVGSLLLHHGDAEGQI